MTFDRDLWQRARPLFDELVELEAGDRSSRLEQIGAEDPALKDALDRLLMADAGAEIDSAFDSPPTAPSTTTSSRDPLGIVGKEISHFRVNDYLATGGMGVVYTAEDLQLGRTVALKFPLPHQQMDRLVKERFVNEARSAAALDHANLCTVHEIGESEHGVFLAMPLYPGETLKDKIARDGALPPDEALAIVQQITTGLASAHAAGIVHRDLKPGNIMLLPDGTVKVLDFGLAKIRDISLTMSHTTIGTIGYVSPEQVRGGRVDKRADLWSIGVMLYEMLTGHLPFQGDHELSVLHDILHAEPPLPSEANKSLSPMYDEIVGALLQKNPEVRYPSAEALLADVVALRAGAPLSHRAPFWSRTRQRRRARTWLRPIGAAGALVAAAGVLVWITMREKPGSSRGPSPALVFVNNSAVISTSAELLAALSPANAGRRVHLRAGSYDIDRPLSVPDGMTLEGEGVMLVGADGRATGLADAKRTTVRMKANIPGDLLTLGNNVTVRNLEILDLEGRSGNVVAVSSRRPADSISATIVESLILNPNNYTIGPGGPLGRALVVLTRGMNMGNDPRPDVRSALAVRVIRSVIHSPTNGGGFFAFNFAPSSRISLEISRSMIGGTNEAAGGVSRSGAVHDSEVRIVSVNNTYRNEWKDQCASPFWGWNLTGGAAAPIPKPVPQAVRNRLVMRSLNDRLDGFTTAVLATGSRVFNPPPLNIAPRDNHISLALVGTTISTPSCGAVRRAVSISGAAKPSYEQVADLRLVGGEVEIEGVEAGDGNTVLAELRGVTGSGSRFNAYANTASVFGPIPAKLQGKGNRLEIVGDRHDFIRNNRAIDPVPAAEFFTGGR